LENAVKHHGFVSAHLYPHWFGLAPDAAQYYPYYAKCCELDIPIMMQVGQNLIYQRARRLSTRRLTHTTPLSIAYGPLTAAARTPAKIAIREGARTLTYSQSADRIQGVTRACVEGLRVERGDRVVLLAPNCIEYLELVAGVAAAGAATATLNPKLVAREIAYTCDDCGARARFVHPSLEAIVQSIEFATVEHIVTLGEPYERLLAKACPMPPLKTAEWEPFVLHDTLGTTGEPKGVVVPHRSRCLHFLAMAAEYGCYSPDDRYLATAPMFHGAGYAFAMAAVLLGGYCEVLPYFDPQVMLSKLHDERMTGTFMVPTHFHALFELEKDFLAANRPRSLKTIVSNAAPLAQATKERIVDYFGEDILHETYGSTEVGIATNLRPPDQLRKEKCVGLPFVGVQVKILDDDGQLVAPDEVGELYSTSPYLFNGYWNEPEQTEVTFRGEWFTAGDMAIRDDEGYIYIVDRRKDMVISGGINIYPREIEEVLFRHDEIVEAAVVGVPDAQWGEALKGFIVCRAGHAQTSDQLQTFMRDYLAAYKVPRPIEFVEELPKNVSGKVLKRTLKEL
ncbi:MAG: AMP-binding protein, partial [Chromatiales bacterium]|nr:AMP-binding protein [Chromatiales bacterium]